MLRRPQLSATTQLAAVIGDPIAHSLSPAIHNAAFDALELDWVYLGFRVEAGGGAAALEAARRLGVSGLSVTMPLKAEIEAAADQVESSARRLGAANCVVRHGDSWVAHNTDGDGFVADLHRSHQFDPRGRSAVVLGAGGAARAVISALVEAGASVAVVARRAEAAAAAVDVARSDDPNGGSATVATAAAVEAADLVVNATSLGMGDSREQPVDPGVLRRDALAIDLVYHPLETRWMSGLRARGVDAHNGVGMLVGQAALQFELWTSRSAPVDVMWDAVTRAVARRD